MAEKSFEEHMEDGVAHPMLPIPLLDDAARTERVSAYVELPLLRFLERYKVRMGARSLSEVIRRLTILGAERENYKFDESRGA